MSAKAHRASLLRQCSGCGATIEFADEALSTRCSYCDSPTVDEPRATAQVDAVVAFSLPLPGSSVMIRDT